MRDLGEAWTLCTMSILKTQKSPRVVEPGDFIISFSQGQEREKQLFFLQNTDYKTQSTDNCLLSVVCFLCALQSFPPFEGFFCQCINFKLL